MAGKYTAAEKLDEHGKARGIARNTWIKQAIDEKMQRETGETVFGK